MVTSLDQEELRRKYAEERDKRLRPDGNDQYLRLTGELAHYRDDPHTPWTERAPRTDHRTVVCVGGGFAGLVVGARLREAGHSFHTSRWDYGYTGGDYQGAPMDKLADQRVGLIGTGATAVQCVPYLARDARELYVFQRTPSSVDARDNHPIDPGWFAGVATPGWQQRWLENFTANQAGGAADVDLVQDGWTDIARRIRARIAALPPESLSPAAML